MIISKYSFLKKEFTIQFLWKVRFRQMLINRWRWMIVIVVIVLLMSKNETAVDLSLEKVQQKIVNVMGPLARVWRP